MSLGIAILAYQRPVKLEYSLQSYQNNGLFDLVDEVYLHFNGRTEETNKVMENWPNVSWGGDELNYGIGWGMIKAIEGLNTDSVLFLEEDFYLSKSKEETKEQIEAGLTALENGIDMVKYREVEDYKTTSNEAVKWATVDWRTEIRPSQWYIGFSDDWVFGDKHPELCTKINDKLYSMSSKHAHYSNNPYLCKKVFVLRLSRDVGFVTCKDPSKEDPPDPLYPGYGRHPDFEQQVWDYWLEQDYTMGIVKGLFKHYPEYGF